jgi:hypothetical protein
VRTLKLFGLAALAAVAAMAFVGASSAMASSTLLCNNDEALGSCSSATTHVHAVATDGKLLTSLGTVLCQTALLLADALALGAPQVLHGNLTYSNCELVGAGTACEVKEVSLGILLEVLRTATELGEVKGTGEVSVVCTTVISCTYKGANLVGHALGPLLAGGGTTGDTSYSEATVEKVKGLLCPATSKLDADFVNLTAVYLNS